MSDTSRGTVGWSDHSGSNRRLSPRHEQDLSCKVFHPATRKFVPVLLRDISSGGVMIETLWPFALSAGDSVVVFLREHAHEVQNADRGIRANAAHVMTRWGMTRAGLRFEQEQDLATLRGLGASYIEPKPIRRAA